MTFLVTLAPISDTWSIGKSIVESVILICAGLYCLIITLYVWITFFMKKCKTRGYTQIEEVDKESLDGESYKESFRRRISGGRKYDKRNPFFKNRANKLKKAYSDIGRVPSPAYTRSDLNDFI